MKITQAFYTLSWEVKDLFVEKYSLNFDKEKSNNDVLFFVWEKDEENVYVLVYIREIAFIETALESLNEHFIVFHHILLTLSLPFGTHDMKEGDIVTPYSFLLEWKEQKALFLENIVGENISFPHFWLVLNGISVTLISSVSENTLTYLGEKYWEGTYNNYNYRILAKLFTLWTKQENITVLEQIYLWENGLSIDNMLLIYDTIVS